MFVKTIVKIWLKSHARAKKVNNNSMHQNRTTYLINPINLKGKHLTWSDVGNFAKNDVIKNEYCSLRGCFAYY